MKKPKITSATCLLRAQATVDALANEGATWDMITKALVMAAIISARQSRQAQAILDDGMTAFTNAAFETSEQEKKDRAAKRRKTLGLPEE